MRRLGLVLIVIGLLIIIYPTVNNKTTLYSQQKLINNWQIEHTNTAMHTKTDDQEPIEEQTQDGFDVKVPIGMLVIEKIDLKLPVLQGTSTQNLNIGAGLLNEGAGLVK